MFWNSPELVLPEASHASHASHASQQVRGLKSISVLRFFRPPSRYENVISSALAAALTTWREHLQRAEVVDILAWSALAITRHGFRRVQPGSALHRCVQLL